MTPKQQAQRAARKADAAAAIARARPRNVPRYNLVINPGALIVVQMPEYLVPWRVILPALHEHLKQVHGITGRSIHAIEPFAPEEDIQGRQLCEAAFTGEPTLKKFWLHIWDNESCGFVTYRKPLEPEYGKTTPPAAAHGATGETHTDHDAASHHHGADANDKTPQETKP